MNRFSNRLDTKRVKALLLCCSFISFIGLSTTRAQDADSAYLSKVKSELRAVWPSNRTVTLVFHGHSVPAGYWNNHEVHTLESYPHLVLEKLKAKYPFTPVNIIVT
ncbi:MAG: hypothetical protein WKF89_10840, partial [Chitinophagaceae bacterium]